MVSNEWGSENIEVPEFKIFNDGIVVGVFKGEITADNVNQTLEDEGISRGQVTTVRGEDLLPNDMPATQDLVITQINKAG
jgi:hypothetical protein